MRARPYWLRQLIHRRYIDRAYGSGYDETREQEVPRPLGLARLPWLRDVGYSRAIRAASRSGLRGGSSLVRPPTDVKRPPYLIEKHRRPAPSRGASAPASSRTAARVARGADRPAPPA